MLNGRKHPPAKVGDRFGRRRVTRLLARDFTANERVEWRCACGVEGVGYVFNLRKTSECRTCAMSRAGRKRRAERRAS